MTHIDQQTHHDPPNMTRTLSTLTCFRRTASDNSASRYCTSLRWAENSCHLIDDAPPTSRLVLEKKQTALCWCFAKFLQEENFLGVFWNWGYLSSSILLTSHGSSQLLSMRDSSCWGWNGQIFQEMTLMPYHHYPTPQNACRATTCTSWSNHFWALADPAPGAWQIEGSSLIWGTVIRGSFPMVIKHCSSFWCVKKHLLFVIFKDLKRSRRSLQRSLPIGRKITCRFRKCCLPNLLFQRCIVFFFEHGWGSSTL